jgi:hypothetical protein
VAAFSAAEETNLAFISSTQLAKPPDSKVVLTFGALNLDRGHGLDLTFFFNNHDLVFGPFMGPGHLVCLLNIPDISAFPTLELTTR